MLSRVILWLLAGGLSYAQPQVTASLRGVVSDASGAVVSGAKVTVTNNATNQGFTTETDTAGTFNVPGLSPGPYSVTVSVSGFATVRRTANVTVGNDNLVTIVFAVGGFTSEIRVLVQDAHRKVCPGVPII